MKHGITHGPTKHLSALEFGTGLLVFDCAHMISACDPEF
jgi:hypothetical protein